MSGKNQELERLLQKGAELGASDLFLIPGEPPAYRVRGELERAEGAPLSGDDLERIVVAAIGKERAAKIGVETGDVVTTCGVEGVVEGRMCVGKSMGLFTAVVRLLPSELPDPEKARVPRALLDATAAPSGLIICAGLTGSGKHTVALMLLDYMNAHRGVHVITIENPVVMRLEPKKALIQQQSVGIDTPSSEDALRMALLKDPDVIFLGEIRNLVELQACVTAAELGHLVVTTIHAASPERAIERMVDVQPEETRAIFRRQLAAILRAACASTLIPEASGKGRVAAYGVLVPDDEMRQAIREGKDLFERRSPLPAGCRTLAEDVEALRKEGRVTAEAAREAVAQSARAQ